MATAYARDTDEQMESFTAHSMEGVTFLKGPSHLTHHFDVTWLAGRTQ